MAINKKLIFWKSSTFNPPTTSTDVTKDVLWNSIVFFSDTAGGNAGKMWTHGLYYDCIPALTQQLTGFVVGSNVAISSSDTILSAFGKTQAQLNNKLSLSGGTLSGTVTANNPITEAVIQKTSTSGLAVLRMLSTGQSHDKGLGLSLSGDLIFGDWSSVNSLSSTWNKVWHSGNLANGTTSQYIRGDGSLATYTDTTYSLMSLAELNTGTATTSRVVNSKNLNDWLNGKDYVTVGYVNSTLPTNTKRDFINGTLVTTSINYSVTNGSPFYMTISGNSYGRINSVDTVVQGYIYNNTIINYGVTHKNPQGITGIIAMNVGGNLCFWFPRQSYWEGYSIMVTTALNYNINTITSITDEVKPVGTKEVNLSLNSKQAAYHNDNLSNFIDNIGVATHIANTNNPHSVTKTQVGLSNVENTALSTWAGSGNITALGNVVSGTWSANTIAVTKGGTGKSSVAANSMLYATANDAYGEVATTAFGRGLLNTATGVEVTGLRAATATKLASINTTFSGTYPVAFNVSGTIYSHTGLTFTGSTGALTANTFIGDLSGTATNATTATTASKVLLHSGNEVNIGGSLASGRLYVNYNDDGNFTEYGFYNGGTSLAKIYASTFFGELSGNATSATNLSRSIIAGNGLSGGGVLNADRTITLGTPGTLSNSTTNSVTTTSHTHAIDSTNFSVLDANRLNVPDTRSVNDAPSDIPNKSITAFFKTASVVQSPPVSTGASYAHILNMNGYNSGNSGGGGHTTQLAFGDSLAIRQSTSTSAWGAWTRLALVTDNVASASKVNNSLSLKFDTGTTEGTNLYTFDGATGKTIDIKAGSNVSISKAAGVITISSTDTNTVYTHPTTSGNKHIPSGGESGQILRWNSDGTAEWGADNNTTYSAASDTVAGLVKVFSESYQSANPASVSTTANRTYLVQKITDANGLLVVNVPWVDTDTTYSLATTSTLGLVKLGSDAQQTVAAAAVTATASRSYAVQVNSSGQMVVNVPWVDTNTTYSNFVGGTSSVTGTAGLVPAPTTANYTYFLKGTGAWTQVNYSDLAGTVPTWNQSTTGSAGSVKSNATTGIMQITGPTAGTTRVMTTPDANFTAAALNLDQTFSGTKTFTLQTLFTGGLVVKQTSGAGVGISLYDTAASNPTYGLMFAQTSGKGTHGSVTGDWATYFTMTTTTGRGWIFTTNPGGTTGNVASVSNTGIFVGADFKVGTNSVWHAGNLSPVTTNTDQTIGGVKTFSTGTTLTFGLETMPSGSIRFANGADGYGFPTIIGKSTSGAGTGLFICAGTSNVNTNSDMLFSVRQQDNNDYSDLTKNAFRWSRYATNLMTLGRNGLLTLLPAINSISGASQQVNTHEFSLNSANAPTYSTRRTDSGYGMIVMAMTINNNTAGADMLFNVRERGNVDFNSSYHTQTAFRWDRYGTTLMSLTRSGNLTAVGNITGYSDIRLKKDIETVSGALDKVRQLRGVYFKRKDGADENRHVGVIAQEIEQVLPEVVCINSDGIRSVAYGNITALLIEAIKEQQKQIDELKTICYGS